MHGFSESDQDSLSIALLEIARAGEINQSIETTYGTKYVIDGQIHTPSGSDC